MPGIEIKGRSKRANYRYGGKARREGAAFPDHSGDGKITQKAILMAKGVIPKTKKQGKK